MYCNRKREVSYCRYCKCQIETVVTANTHTHAGKRDDKVETMCGDTFLSRMSQTLAKDKIIKKLKYSKMR